MSDVIVWPALTSATMKPLPRWIRASGTIPRHSRGVSGAMEKYLPPAALENAESAEAREVKALSSELI
jgi:hypothetical protein